MESANLPLHLDLHQEHQQQQQQHQLAGSSSSSSSLDASSSAHGSWYGAPSDTSNHFAWPPNSPILNNNGSTIYQNISTEPYNARTYTGDRDDCGNEEIQIPWSNSHNNNSNSIADDHQHQTLISTHCQPSNKSKLDLFNSLLFPKFSDMISSTQSSIEDLQHLSPTFYMKTDDQFQDLNQLDTKLLKPNIKFSSGFMHHPQFQAAHFLANAQNCSRIGGSSSSPLMPSRGALNQIFPSVNISNLNNITPENTMISGPLDMNLQPMDLLTSARFGAGGMNQDHQPQPHHLGLAKESRFAFGQHMQQQFAHTPTTGPNKVSATFANGGSITESKRSQTETKASQASSKKSRSESRACPPFKVRKEKLGDRIAALQQLVAPFGKTDTASVLMEAIGYIKFLQNQVETLSVPYMKPSHNRPMIRPTHMGHMVEDDGNSEESRRDLRSRGLCLVPLSCMSYVTSDDGCGWPPTDYHGGT